MRLQDGSAKVHVPTQHTIDGKGGVRSLETTSVVHICVLDMKKVKLT